MIYSKYFGNNSTLKSYFDNNDYFSAGTYIRTSWSSANNKEDALSLVDEGTNLQRQGRIYNSKMSIANNTQKQAISFLNAFNEGAVLPLEIDSDKDKIKNKFTEKFNNAVNEFYKDGDIARFIFQTKTVKRNPIPALGFLTDWLVPDEEYARDGYDAFLQNIGMTHDQFDKYLKDNDAGSIGYKNGVAYLNLKNNNNQVMAKVATALYNTVDENGNNRWGATMMKYKKDENGKLISTDNGFVIDEDSGSDFSSFIGRTSINTLNNDNNQGDYVNVNNPFNSGMGSAYIRTMLFNNPVANVLTQPIVTNNLFGEDPFNDFTSIGRLVEKAKSVENEMLEDKGLNKTAYTIIRTPFKTLGHQQLNDALQKGKIKSGEYDKLKEDLDEYYDSAIASFGYTQSQVYSNFGDAELNDKTLVARDVEDRAKIQDFVSQAWSKKKLSYQLGVFGDTTGMYITIPAYTVKTDPNNEKEKEYPHEITIFVPNMLPQSEEALIKSDTNFQASSELFNMNKYGYDYELSNGDTVTCIKGNVSVDDGFYALYHRDGTSETISASKALNLMNRQKIIETGIKGVISAAYDYKGNKHLVEGNWTIDNDGDKKIAEFAFNAVFELFPDLKNISDNSYKKRVAIAEAFKLYNDIYNAANADGNSFEYFKDYFKDILSE